MTPRFPRTLRFANPYVFAVVGVVFTVSQHVIGPAQISKVLRLTGFPIDHVVCGIHSGGSK